MSPTPAIDDGPAHRRKRDAELDAAALALAEADLLPLAKGEWSGLLFMRSRALAESMAREILALRKMLAGMTERVGKQSDLLSRAAERRESAARERLAVARLLNEQIALLGPATSEGRILREIVAWIGRRGEQRRVRMTKTVRSDLPFPPFAVAQEGQEYRCEMNVHGAASADVDGVMLGLKPDEFEWVKEVEEPR